MGIEIKPSEIDSVDYIGDLDGDQVKMIRTVGGLYLALGKPRGKMREEVLAAGSHPGIVKYNIKKNFQTFQPALMKSSFAQEEHVVVGFSDLLPPQMIKKGYDLYGVKLNDKVDFVLTKSQVEITKYEAKLGQNEIVIQKPNIVLTHEIYPVAKATVRAAAMTAVAEGLDLVTVNGKKFPSKRLAK